MRVQSFENTLLPQLQALVNLHLTTALPGWALSGAAIARHLVRDDHQPITDPWVDERMTLCAVEGDRVLAAVHLLRYADRPEVNGSYQGVGTIAWLLACPDRSDAAAAVLDAAHEYMAAWGVRRQLGWDTGLPAGPLWGVPDAWPHIAAALRSAGYVPDATLHHEAIYGGWLTDIAPPAEPPIAGLTIQRRVGIYETRIAAVVDNREIGWCDVQPDLTYGGLLPALRSWAWLTELEVQHDWRNRGIGRWLVQSAVAWLRLAGCDRVVLAVTDANEQAGAGRFYQRFGWDVFVRETHGWRRESA